MIEVLPQVISGTVNMGMGKQNPNIYCVLSGAEALIVDAGLYAPETKRFFQNMLEKYAIDPRLSKLFITHDHIDHMGMMAWCADQGMEIMKAPQELSKGSLPVEREEIEDTLYRFGVPDSVDCSALWERALYPPPMVSVPYTPLHEGDSLTIGNYHFSVIALPGHSNDQIGLFDPASEVLFCGDHLLPDIVPVIPANALNENALQTYFESIRKVQSLTPMLLLPGHGTPIRYMDGSLNRVIERITAYYQHYVNRIERLLCEQPRNLSVFALSRCLYRIPERNLFTANAYQHWLMLHKIMVSLEYLTALGRTERIVRGRIPYYSGTRY